MSDSMNDGMNEMNADRSELHITELVQVVVRQRRMIARSCVAAAVISVIVSLILPKTYSATAKILPPQKEGSGIAALLGQTGGLAGLSNMASGLGFGGGADLYLGILKSRSVADAVIKRLGLAKIFKTKTPEETRKKLEGAVKMQAGKDGIISITSESRDPNLAAALANTFVEELGKKSVQLNLTKAGTERAFLEKRLEVVKEDLRNAEESLKSFQERYKTIKVDSQAVASIEGIARLKAEIVSKEVQLASLKSYQTDESPEVKALQAAIRNLRTKLGGLAGSGASGDWIPTMGTVPNLGIEYFRRMRELKIQETIFEQLTKQYEMAKLTEAKDSSSLQVLDDAVVPTKKSKPKRALIVILTTMAALFASVFAAFLAEFWEKMPAEDRARWEDIKGMLSWKDRKGR